MCVRKRERETIVVGWEAKRSTIHWHHELCRLHSISALGIMTGYVARNKLLPLSSKLHAILSELTIEMRSLPHHLDRMSARPSVSSLSDLPAPHNPSQRRCASSG